MIFYWKAGWPADDDELADDRIRGELVFKASACCVALLKQFGTYNIDVENCNTKQLQLHLAIGAGTIYDVHVGGPPCGNRWEHFIAGDVINQISQVLDLAKAGRFL